MELWNKIVKWLRKRLARHLRKEKVAIVESFDVFTDECATKAREKLYQEFPEIPADLMPYVDAFIGFVNKETDEQFERFLEIMIQKIEEGNIVDTTPT